MPLSAPFAGSGTATAGTNVTFNLDCGAADSSKLAVIGLHQTGGSAGKLITAITVDGVNCLANVTQGQRHAKVWCALPSSSGVVTVNLTYDIAPNNFSWGAWTVLGSSGAPTDTQSTFTGSDASRSLAMTIPAGGIGLVSGTKAGTGSVDIVTTNAAEDYEARNGSTHRYIGAHTTTTGAVSPQFDNVSSLVGFAFTPTSIEGTASITEADDTVAATGTVALNAAASITEAADTLAASGALGLTGSASIGLAGATMSSVAVLPIVGTASMSEQDNALASVAQLPIAASAILDEADDTVVAELLWIEGRIAQVDITLDAGTIEAEGLLQTHGTATIQESDDALTASSALLITGSSTISEADDTVLSSGPPGTTGALDIVEADDSISGVGVVLITGTSMQTTAPYVLTSVAEITIQGTLTVTLEGQSIAATGIPFVQSVGGAILMAGL
ncbi:MAG: hypothetical protein AB7V39_06635 [Nitrospiraceae bacterium]